MSNETFDIDQMKLFCDISKAVSRFGKIPADNRANVIIEAANLIVAAYKMTDAEYLASKAK